MTFPLYHSNRCAGIFLIAALLGTSGCATLGSLNPATGRREFIMIPTTTEVAMGSSMHAQIAEENAVIETGEAAARLRRIGESLAAVSDRKDYTYHFYLVDSEELNAFTTPGGNIYFFSGLFDRLETDDAIASVVAHEIGHCAARHTIKRFQASMGYNLIGALIMSQVDTSKTTTQAAGLASNVAMQLVFAAYSRKDEYQADSLGLKYMRLAGYDPQGMIDAFEFLNAESKGPKIPLILRTHPYLDDRIKEIKRQLKPPA